MTGHTDTAGSPAYNQRLSERRANAVKKAVVAEGISASAITATGKGKNQFEVQTSPTIKESRVTAAPRSTSTRPARPASDEPSAAVPDAAPPTEDEAMLAPAASSAPEASASVEPVAPQTDTWNGAWNTYRAEGIKNAHAQSSQPHSPGSAACNANGAATATRLASRKRVALHRGVSQG